MKIKNLLGLMAIFAFASIAFAQTVTITPKKTVYTRKGKVSFKEKRRFTVTYPIVSGTIPAATKKKLENTISYWRVFQTTLSENLSENDWLSEAYYEVNYNKNGILDIALTQEGSAAYPDSHTFNLVVNLKTGEQVKFADITKVETLTKLAEMTNRKLKTEKKEIVESIKNDKETYKNDKEQQDFDIKMINDLSFSAENFDEFSVNDKGMTIFYDAGFPHVIQALQPNGRYFFTWAELKPFIKADGLLGKFVR